MEPRLDTRHSLHDLFAGLVEQTFEAELGVCDPRLTDYLTDMLAEFVHVSRIYPCRTVDGEVIREISRLQAEAALGDGVAGSLRTRIVNKYIGDLTLFWSGVYPESLRARFHGGVARLHEYLEQGKRSYGIASELSEENDRPPRTLLRELSERFEVCVHGLQLVRCSWQQLGPGGPRVN